MNYKELLSSSLTDKFISEDGDELLTKQDLVFKVHNSYIIAIKNDDQQPSPYVNDWVGYANEYLDEYKKGDK